MLRGALFTCPNHGFTWPMQCCEEAEPDLVWPMFVLNRVGVGLPYFIDYEEKSVSHYR